MVCLAVVTAGGCQGTQTRAVEGGVIGGVLGAVAGGIIGHQSHSGAEGAAIGAATGAIAGSVIGAQMPKDAPAAQPAAAPASVSSNQMSVQQIVDLTKQGVNEAVIVDKIRLSNSRFSLTAADVESLRQQGVSQRVIDAMQGL
jgi:hypothetical protein